MLEFIVLGLIPGTHIQITFGWMLVIFAVFAVSVTVFTETYLMPSANNDPKKSKKSNTKKRTTAKA